MDSEVIRLFVNPQTTEREFHEVTPAQLEEYLSERKEDEPKSARRRNPYHQLAIIAKVDISTTEMELCRLLQNDVRTLFVKKDGNKPQDLDQIFVKINNCLDKFYKESSYRTPIGIAVEISGELLTTGRMRNDQNIFLDKGHNIVLTNNEEYKFCCFKEIIYVSNLWRYFEIMKLGDTVHLGDSQIVTRVVKCARVGPLTVKVCKPGLLSSYMRVKMPYYVEGKELTDKDKADIEKAMKYGAHFLVIPGIRSAAFLNAIREYVGEGVGIIGTINFGYLQTKFIDVAEHLLVLDAVWIDNLVYPTLQKRHESAIVRCRDFEKILVGSVPLKLCSDFKKLENHKIIRQMDCLLIQKSPVQMKYPLIVKKLVPVGVEDLKLPHQQSFSCKEGIINFVLRTIYAVPCQGIIVTNACPKAAVAFSLFHIYCPVIIVAKNEQTARLLNLRKNLKTVIFPDESDKAAIEFGTDFAMETGILRTGDFVISISESMDDDSEICVNLRAYFLPAKEEEPLP